MPRNIRLKLIEALISNILKELYKVGYMPYGNGKWAFTCSVLLAPAPHELPGAGALLVSLFSIARALLGTIPGVYWIKESEKSLLFAALVPLTKDFSLSLEIGKVGPALVVFFIVLNTIDSLELQMGERKQPQFSEVSAAVDEAYLEIESSSDSVWGRKARGKFISVCDKVIAENETQ